MSILDLSLIMKKIKKTKIEAHGKIETKEKTKLEQIFGFNDYSKYNTLEESAYASTLNEMNRTDLDSHARKMGVVIVESSERLKERLLIEFRNYILSLNAPARTVHPKVKMDEEVKRILAEGR